MVAMEDEEAQKRGAVIVVYLIGKKEVSPPDGGVNIWKIPTVANIALPIRMNSVHICYDNANLRPVLSFAIHALDTFARVRCRSHFGTLPISCGTRVIPVRHLSRNSQASQFADRFTYRMHIQNANFWHS